MLNSRLGERVVIATIKGPDIYRPLTHSRCVCPLLGGQVAASYSLAFLAYAGPLPETPILPKPYSCGQILIRGGDCAWEAGVEIP